MKINEIISFALISSPMVLSPAVQERSAHNSATPSLRSSTRKMGYLLAAPPHIPEGAINQLPAYGVLKRAEDGFVYLDIEDKYIHDLIHFIESDGYEEPPYFGKPGLVGAHISVAYAREMMDGDIEELGKEFSFTPLECKIIKPLDWDEIESVYLIEVDSPELDQLREKYSLPKNEFAFHITVGIRPLKPYQ